MDRPVGSIVVEPAPSEGTTRYRTSPLAACLLGFSVVVLGAAAFCVLEGVAVRVVALVSAAVLLQTASGALWWAAIPHRGRRTMVEFAGMGLALGTMAAVASAQLLRTTPLATWAWSVPALATLLAFAILPPFRRAAWPAIASYRRLHPADVGWLSAAVVLGSASTISFLSWNPLHWGASVEYFPDLGFHEALTHSLAQFGPDHNILALGGSIHYHWFTHAWLGSMAAWSGAEPMALLLVIGPVVALLGLVLTAWAWAQRLSSNPWVPRVASVLVVAGSYIGLSVSMGDQLIPVSPTQAFTTSWLLAYCIVLTATLCRGVSLRAAGVLLLFISFMLVGGKVSHAVVVAIGTAALALAALLGRQRDRRAIWVAAGATWAGVLLGYGVLLFGGAAAGLAVGMTVRATMVPALEGWPGGVGGIVVAFVALLAAMAAKWSGLVGVAMTPDLRRQPIALFAAAAGAGALVLTVVTTQPGASQVFFMLSASAILTVVGVVGMFALAPSGRPVGAPPLAGRILLVGAATAAITVALVAGTLTLAPDFKWVVPLCAWLVAVVLTVAATRSPSGGRGLRTRLYVVAASMALTSVVCYLATTAAEALKPNSFGPGYTWTRGQYDAAMWLRAHASSEDATLSNRLCTDPAQTPPQCPSMWFQTAALTGLQSWLEGYDVSVAWRTITPTARDQIATTVRFTQAPNADDARRLWDAGVRWVWLDSQVPGTAADWSAVGDVAYANGGVRIIKLRAPAGSG